MTDNEAAEPQNNTATTGRRSKIGRATSDGSLLALAQQLGETIALVSQHDGLLVKMQTQFENLNSHLIRQDTLLAQLSTTVEGTNKGLNSLVEGDKQRAILVENQQNYFEAIRRWQEREPDIESVTVWVKQEISERQQVRVAARQAEEAAKMHYLDLRKRQDTLLVTIIATVLGFIGSTAISRYIIRVPDWWFILGVILAGALIVLAVKVFLSHGK